MQLILQCSCLDDYVQELPEVNFSDASIQALSNKLFYTGQSDIEKIECAFHFVRDHIAHSWDIQGRKVTRTASEVLVHQQGVCYAKSNLLAALLRGQGIPTGFCYQRLMLFDTPEKGYALHALNAVFVRHLNKWIRLDARGNKRGVEAEFSLNEEKLAFVVNTALGEIDYDTIFVKPNIKTMETLQRCDDALTMYMEYLPDTL